MVGFLDDQVAATLKPLCRTEKSEADEQAKEGKDGGVDNSNELLDGAATNLCLLYTSPSPRDLSTSRMPSSA